MKKTLIILFLGIYTAIFSQKKAVQKIETNAKEINIFTNGLDDFIIENSTTNFIEITLFAENPNMQHIFFDTKNKVIDIEFKLNKIQNNETIFRKFITERLERAHAVIKIPEGKNITVFGENINIESKSYQGNLTVFIEKGILKLNDVQASVDVKLYAGNVYANVKKSEIKVTSNIGKIKVDDVFYEKKYQKIGSKKEKNFTINSIKANIFLTTQ
ncbi:hypothetical protein [uncultured Polaribacter sp.]|uniref:hypothetical protein n=1 Tax=uncultured Polaribacter sp. TaxID=174711 RepID=UPI002624FA50|nr:hypothetical protein [uncultured Polaribacter sp.]